MMPGLTINHLQIRKGFTLALLLVASLPLFSQYVPPTSSNSTIDSLVNVLNNRPGSKSKLQALNKLAWEEFTRSRNTGADRDRLIIRYIEDAISLSKQTKNRYEEGLAIHTRAALLRRQGKFSEALQNYYAVLKISEQISDTLCAANQHMNIGDMYSVMKRTQEAIASHEKAQELFLKANSKIGLLYSYRRMFNIYNGMGKRDESLKCQQKILELAIEMKDNRAIAEAYIAMAAINKDSGHYAEAIRQYSAALKLLDDGNIVCQDCYFSVYIGLGWANILHGYFNKQASAKELYLESLQNFQKALHIARQTRSKWYLNEAYSGLARIYKYLNDYKNALEYTVLQHQLQDSTFNQASMEKLAMVKEEYEREKVRTEEAARLQLAMEREKSLREKMLSGQLIEGERKVAEQKLYDERRFAEEKIRLEQTIAAEKMGAERIRLEKERTRQLYMLLLVLVTITSAFVILFFRQRILRRRAVEKAEATQNLAQLELQSLRSQLNPHFMFNSLNSLQELILLRENKKSHSYLSRFARLLRMLLDNSEMPFITLSKELEFLETYLRLETLRLSDLKYEIVVEESLDPERTMIPNMILQPYIENALWHGLSTKEGEKKLSLRISRNDEVICFEIEDNGIGRTRAREIKAALNGSHQSLGMELLSKRFKLLNTQFSTQIKTSIEDLVINGQISGTRVIVSVPEMKPAFSEMS